MNHDYIELQRDCEALLIPTGVPLQLQKGTPVIITQALGDSYTVYINGNLARLAGKDGDAIDRPVIEMADIQSLEGSISDKVWALLKMCFDPEIPVNIVDLGLVYACDIQEKEDKKYHIHITMTLTAAACGMGPVLVAEVEKKLSSLSEVAMVKVDLVFDPPWDREKMSDAARLQLGLL